MFGIATSQNFYIPEFDEAQNFNVDIDGDLLIDSSSNTNNEIAHQQTTLERLTLTKDVEGILHYSVGARTSSKLIGS